ncbi:hypothetical protein FSP39_013698 [Pinctada imbricata]|uniref:Tyr recombinase domain-containing protein n=1 Tax=Pinctada imbricata TaxID=66713 RepID=A0AA88XJ12_PINIB|nr:hypothetical protein FSP39_013698 [Pinctada imbricata]
MFLQAFKQDIMELPKALADKVDLLTELIMESRSEGTVKCYYSAFMRWKKWAQSYGISESEVLPAKAFNVALYLVSLVQNSRSPGPVISAFYGIKWAHSLISAPSPTECVLVKNVLEGAKRRLHNVTVKKEPITPDLLQKMYDALHSHDNLYNKRSICACLISYAGFLRVSELLNLRISDFEFFPTHMSIFIEKSKTDVYREGNWLVISRTGTKLCPVSNIEDFFSYVKFSEYDSFVFRDFTKTRNGYILRKENKHISYTRMRELFIEAFSPFVVDIHKYGLHSLRAGGATAAANCGVPDRLFKRHGRWKSETAKDGYVKDDLCNRLFVSKNLGI